METINTHNKMIDFGMHRGERWTRLPVSYLKWIMNEPTMRVEVKLFAQSELARRGTTTPTDLEISGHAIDRASLQCWKIYYATRRKNEGLHAWLYRIAVEALALGGDEVRYLGMKFVFKRGDYYPVLITVVRG